MISQDLKMTLNQELQQGILSLIGQKEKSN